MSDGSEQLHEDAERTRVNRGRLARNRNLMYWYQKLYEAQFSPFEDPANLKILEIGSGTSPLKIFLPHVITSDLLPLDYLDHIFDCHEIDQRAEIPDSSLDVITLTNVLHHLRMPLLFLERARAKLKRGGSIIMTEPYFSWASTPIYQMLHHERADFNIRKPELDHVAGPLSSANMSIPYLLFFGNRGWSDGLRSHYNFDNAAVSHYSSMSYMLTGGISRRIPVPFFLYKAFFCVDAWLARNFPRTFSAFFIIRMIKR